MTTRYLKQGIVVRKDLCMPSGKLAAMVAHASMTFLLKSMENYEHDHGPAQLVLNLSPDEVRWLTELDPGLEEAGQVSMAKIVLQVGSEAELLEIENKARDAGLVVHSVIDSGHSHNPAGTFTCIAIGPAWPEQLEPITGGLKVYR